VDLPVTVRPGDRAGSTVYLDTPASVTIRLPVADDRPASSTMCTEHRCVHRWTPVASAKNQATPRLRIREPGRYEVTMTHVENDQSHRQDFVIHAKR
jgi:hypothetical protein